MMVMLLALALANSELKASPSTLDQFHLDAISSRCGSPHRRLVKRRHGSVRLRPRRKAGFQKVDCVLDQLVPRTALGCISAIKRWNQRSWR